MEMCWQTNPQDRPEFDTILNMLQEAKMEEWTTQ